MNVVGSILAATSILLLYQSVDKLEEVKERREDLPWKKAEMVTGWTGVGFDILNGDWLNPLKIVGSVGTVLNSGAEAAIDTRNFRVEKQRLMKAEARYHLLLSGGIWCLVISVVVLTIGTRRAIRRERILTEQLQSLQGETERLKGEFEQAQADRIRQEEEVRTSKLKRRQLATKLVYASSIIMIFIGCVAFVSQSWLTRIATNYVREGMGEDAELVRLRQVFWDENGRLVIHAEFRYHESTVGKIVTTSWELDLDPLKGMVDDHRMEPL